MKTRLILLLVCSGIIRGLYAQHINPDYSDDDFFLEDSSVSAPVEMLNLFGVGRPTSYKSLKEYMPPALNLMDSRTPPSSAVIWAFTYQAMSIQYRSELHQTLNFSYSYVFNQMSKNKDCRFTVNSINELSKLLKTTGTVLSRDFKQLAQCSQIKAPAPASPHYKLKDLYLLFDSQCNEKNLDCIPARLLHNKVSRIKIVLSQNKPVIALLKVHAGFHLLNKEFIEYDRNQTLHTGSKTIVIIGFDEEKQAFEVTFPAGKSWGKNGIALLKYTDLPYVSKAYSLVLDKKTQSIAQAQEDRIKTSPPPPSTSKVISARPKVKAIRPAVVPEVTEVQNLKANISVNELFLRPGHRITTKSIPLYISDKMVRLQAPLSPDQYYQISIRNLSEDSYFYVLNIEKDKKQVHFPVNKELSDKPLETKPISPYVISGSADFYVPRPRTDPETGNLIPRGFVKRDPEKEYMVLLFSKERIDGRVRTLMQNMVYSPDHENFYNQLCRLLETGPIVPVLKSSYENREIQFDSHLTNGTVFPVVITIKGQ